jgi:hypothetical protein
MMKVKIFTVWDEPEESKHSNKTLEKYTQNEMNRFLAGKAIFGCDEDACPANATGDCPVPIDGTLEGDCEKVIYPIPNVKFVTQSRSQDSKNASYVIISIFYEEEIIEKSPESDKIISSKQQSGAWYWGLKDEKSPKSGNIVRIRRKATRRFA